MRQHPFDDGDAGEVDDLSDVLNFSGADGSAAADDGDHAAAWDFSVAGEDDGESAVDAIPAYVAADHEDSGTEFDAIRPHTEPTAAGTQDDEGAAPLFTVTNPPGTVSVSALMDGGIDRVGLSAKVTSMTETQLAEEILVMAHLARQKGQGAQHALLLEGMRQLGADDTDALKDLLENGMELSTAEQAEAAQAEVFATRYATDK